MGFKIAPSHSLEASRLITFNTNITHLSDVPCSSREYRGGLKNRPLTRSGSGMEASSWGVVSPELWGSPKEGMHESSEQFAS
jgi:hypothetical protein